jgi:hypothetical protein
MNSSRVISAAHGTGAFILAIAFLFLGDATALPYINAWALAHGFIFVIFPVYFAVAYFLLRPLARRLAPMNIEIAERPKRVSALAIVSPILSGSGFIIPFVGSLLGIAAGHIALHRCRNDQQLTGAGFARAGLILGYLFLAYAAYVFVMVSWVVSRHGS